MGDMGDTFRAFNEERRLKKAKFGIDCPGCPKVQPKRIPTRLLPGQRCKVCGYVYKPPKPKKVNCDVCMGSSWLDVDAGRPCPHCGGTGKVDA